MRGRIVVAVEVLCSLGLFLLVGGFSSRHLHQVLRANCLGTQTFGIGTGMNLRRCVFMQDVVVWIHARLLQLTLSQTRPCIVIQPLDLLQRINSALMATIGIVFGRFRTQI